MVLFATTAASLVPSPLDATAFHALVGGPLVPIVQLAPESFDQYSEPPLTVATSLVPSELEAIADQFLSPKLIDVQLTPESVDVYIALFCATAASLVPSVLEATAVQFLFPNPD
jgi:hypothetical protein